MIRVVIADDEALVRSGLRMILEMQPDIQLAGDAPDGRSAVELARRTHPDVVLMDIRMPRMDGLQATERLLAAPRALRVLILTTFDLDEYVYRALHAGASGFLLKSSRPDELVAAVRGTAAGDTLLAPAVTRRLVEAFVRHPPPGGRTTPALASLTPREREVFQHIAHGRSNAEIAGLLHVTDETVKTHASRIFMKLGVRDRTQAVILAYEHGIIQPGTAPPAEPHGSARSGSPD